MSKDPITCHVLDTTAGRPASGIKVTLEHSSSAFNAVTDADGRIKNWTSTSGTASVADALGKTDGAASRWTLRFDTGAYFGDDKTFFPEAVIVFRVDKGQHYHVPLLLSPYSYTTYRGS